jgi:hypothetical protein
MAVSLNIEIAKRLEEVARLLEEQHANPFRIQAYRHAAGAVRWHRRSMREVLAEEGIEGLRRLPGIGESLARAIHDLVVSGRLPMLDRLRGEADPVTILRSVPGIGRVMAQRIHEDLDIDTLEQLEIAAHDGRLADRGHRRETPGRDRRLTGRAAWPRARAHRWRRGERASGRRVAPCRQRVSGKGRGRPTAPHCAQTV